MGKKEEAFLDWRNGMKYAAIAEKHGVSLSAVKSWAAREWKPLQSATGCKAGLQPQERLQPEKAAPVKRPGAPLGNQNAKGNRGGGAPKGNHNALKHGFYSDLFTQEEQRLLSGFSGDAEQLLEEQIQLLSIRERRMLRLIQRELEKPVYLERIDKKESTSPGGAPKEESREIRSANTLLLAERWETLLSRVQSQKVSAIEKLARIRRERIRQEALNQDEGNPFAGLTTEELRKLVGDDT